jgi:iron uptake system component EfeO
MCGRTRVMRLLALTVIGSTALLSGGALAAVQAKTVTVTLTAAGCPRKITTRAGKTTFDVRNDGADTVSEFEVLEGHKVLGEKENLAPGLSGSFSLTLEPGTYSTYCPGGDRQRGKLVVVGASSRERAHSTAGASTTVRVTLHEYAIEATRLSAPAGDVKFKVTNRGGLVHEFVVVRLDGAALVTAPDGSAVEDEIPEADDFGELEDLERGDTATLKAKNLAPGTYQLFCNVVDHADGTTVSHYAKGMTTEFTVR